MCGRFALALDAAAVKALFKAYLDASMDAWSPSFNIAPSVEVPALERDEASGALSAKLRRWGAPSRSGGTLANFRSESLSNERLTAKGARRYAIPASAFYEWRRAGRTPEPFIVERSDGEPLLLAAFAPPGSSSFAIATRSSSAPLDSIHRRAPVALRGESFELWLSGGTPAAAFKAPQPGLSLRRADPRVNRVSFKVPEALATYEGPEEIPLL